MVILKTVYNEFHKDIKDPIRWETVKEEVFNFINKEKLEENGWINSLLEGGFVSPDHSTIYYYGRTPYEGQLIQFNRDTEGFNKIKQHYLDSGEFIEV